MCERPPQIGLVGALVLAAIGAVCLWGGYNNVLMHTKEMQRVWEAMVRKNALRTRLVPE